MPPALALVLCLALVLALYFREAGVRQPVATWLAVIWMMYSGSRPLEYWFGGSASSLRTVDDIAAGSPLDRTFLSILIIAGLYALARRRVRWAVLVRHNAWLAALFGFMAVSILWSDDPGISAKRWFRATGDLVMVLVLLTTTRPLDAITSAFRRTAYTLLPFSLLLVKYFPAIGVEYTENGTQTMWIGVTTQKNVLGYTAMVCGLASAHSLVSRSLSRRARSLSRRERSLSRRARSLTDVALILVAVVLLGGSSSAHSETSLTLFWVGIALLIASIINRRDPRRLIIWSTAFLVLLCLVALLIAVDNSLFSTFGRDATLTGRTVIWDIVLAIGPGDPLIGRGYGSFWVGDRVTHVWRAIWTPITQSHNGYIDIYLELGIVGLILLAGVIRAAFKGIRKTLSVDFDYGTLRWVFLCLLLLHNVTESSFGRPTHLLWFLFLLVAVNVPVPRTVSTRPASRGAHRDLEAMVPLATRARE